MEIKTKIIIGIISALTIALGVSIFIYFNNKENVDSSSKIELREYELKFEYGEPVNISTDNIVKTDDSKIIDTVKLDYSNFVYEDDKDYPKVGDYVITVSYKVKNKDYNEKIFVEVVDSISPVFTKFEESFEIEKDTTDFVYDSYYEAIDLTDVKITINDSEVEYRKIGEYKITITAVDENNNSRSKDAKVIIIKKKNPITETPSINNNSGSSANSATCNSTATEVYKVNGIIVVNKKHPLPCGYAPGEDATAKKALKSLIADMQALGMNVSNSYSGYRSYSTQYSLYNNYAKNHGAAKADTFSARAGYSEHQTGLAYDLKFKSTGGLITDGSTEAKWISEHAHEYGFIVRYMKGKDSITGYTYEPWHLRYIGSEATAIYKSGKTLEEYLGIEGGGYN